MVILKSGDVLLVCVGENILDRDMFVFWVFNGIFILLDNNEDFYYEIDFEYF